MKLNADSVRYYIGVLIRTHAKKLYALLSKRGTDMSDFLSSQFGITSSNNLECSEHEEILNSSTSEAEELLSVFFSFEESKLNVSNLSRSLFTETQLCKETEMEVKKLNNKLARFQKNEMLSDVQRKNMSL